MHALARTIYDAIQVHRLLAMPRTLAALVCRQFAIGCCGSTPPSGLADRRIAAPRGWLCWMMCSAKP